MAGQKKSTLKTGMVVAPQPVAVEVGARILKGGGNAFDAAIATAFAQMVCDPQMCGVGGFGCMTLYDATRDATHVIDFNATAGAAATPTQWADRIVNEQWDGYGWVLDGLVNDIGYGAIATPGTVAGLAELHSRFASLPWADLLQPAIDIARDGFLVSPELARRWTAPATNFLPGTGARITFNEASRQIYLNAEGKPYGLGERFRNPDYAATLERLAERGPEEFYTGELARRIAEDLEANGSTVTFGDLQSYRPRSYDPLLGSYLDHTIATTNPPGGGVTILEMLNILEGYDLPALGHNTEDYVFTMARAQIAAMIDRAEHVGDGAFIDVPVAMLAGKERASAWRARIDSGEPLTVPRYHPDSPTTTNVSVVDAAGNGIAITHTLGASSGVITPGLGFMYNNAMNCFDPRPGTVNSITPGKGRITGIAPTIAFAGDRPRVVLGAPGGTRIMTGILQALVNILAFDMSAVEAVSAPRLDCQSDTLDGEARIPSWVLQAAADRAGLKVWPNPAPYGNFALVQAIVIDPATGVVTGGADPRSGGAVMAG
jgi:gamma-glutamyltranspeptidase/glutathione hydrolase